MKKTYVTFSDKPLKVIEPDTKAVIGETEEKDTPKDFADLVLNMYRTWIEVDKLESEPLVTLS
jgi:hypothetical protein